MINIKKIVYSDKNFSANTYIISDINDNCFVVDPGIDDINIINYIKSIDKKSFLC